MKRSFANSLCGGSVGSIAAVLFAFAPSSGPTVDQSEQTDLATSHWSFVTPTRPEMPPVGRPEWVRNPIDRLVLARLDESSLPPSPQADRRTLIRRVTLDLTGLPPTLGEIAAYLAEQDPGAYERVVDRLLDSPHYGERMALQWLDLARYADTNGYSIDGGRHMWAWRDWVINAYNQNMPFDQFTIEQLAGDLLPDATINQKIASAFNRNHMNTHEGGTIEEEYRVAYVVDRVKTTAQTWMGLTMACAQCHDHKYDPISQKEYYRFFAYFNTITDRGNDGNSGINSKPFLSVYSPEQQDQLRRIRHQLTGLKAELSSPNAALHLSQLEWEKEERRVDRIPAELGAWNLLGPFTESTGDVAFATAYGPEEELDLTAGYGEGEAAHRWEQRPDLVDGKTHALTGTNSAWYLTRTISQSRDGPLNLSFGSDDSIKVWFDGDLVLDNNAARGVAPDQEQLALQASEGDHTLLVKIVNYGGPGGFYFNLLRSGPPPRITELVGGGLADRTDDEAAELQAYFRSIAPDLEELRQEIAGTERQIDEIDANPVTTVMVMQEMAEPRDTFVLARGHYELRGDKVTTGIPACLPPLSADAPPTRLGLAQWLVDPSHPLTARVAVNRYWQMLFGNGLVRTSEDFGTRGESPSHPQLLDWLAVEFVKSSWDIKAMLRLMVTSATYRQASNMPAELAQHDPENRLLARGPRFRLQAEFIRDAALASSGLLVAEIGGPSVRPYQPDGLWKEMSHFGSTPATEQVYMQDTGEKLYRRSLYTIWKRTLPPPPMVAFDAPNRELCTVRRPRTNTPIQALVMLNETGFVEAARCLAERMLVDGGPTREDKLRYGFELVTSRQPDARELAILINAIHRGQETFDADPAAAHALLTIGDAPRNETLDGAEYAAWTVVANLMLNLSEMVTKG